MERLTLAGSRLETQAAVTAGEARYPELPKPGTEDSLGTAEEGDYFAIEINQLPPPATRAPQMRN